MHLYFITRGAQQNVNIFSMFLQTQMWAWERKDPKTGKKRIIGVQGSLRPVQLWEYVFPEECYDDVCSMLNVALLNERWTKGHLGSIKPAVLRKMLGNGVKPVKPYKTVPARFCFTEGIGIYPVGIKYDDTIIHGFDNKEQEAL